MILPRIFRRNRNTEAIAIGIIGISDRPCIIKKKRVKREARGEEEICSRWQKTLFRCREQVVPRDKAVTGDELRQHLIEQYDAVEFDLLEGIKNIIKTDVLSTYYPETIPHPPMPADNASKRKWIKWAIKDLAAVQAAVNTISDEEYGLRFIGLRVPRNRKTEPYYAALEQERGEDAGMIEFLVELSTGYLQTDNGCPELQKEILFWRGLTKDDIENSTPAFMSYASVLYGQDQVQDCAAR